MYYILVFKNGDVSQVHTSFDTLMRDNEYRADHIYEPLQAKVKEDLNELVKGTLKSLTLEVGIPFRKLLSWER